MSTKIDEERMIAVDAVPQERPPAARRPRSSAGRAAVVGLVAVGLVVAGGLGLFPRHGPDPDRTAGASANGSALMSDAALPADTLSASIVTLQAKLRTDPDDGRSWAYLGFAYVQQARVTADPTYYSKADGALARSLRLRPTGNVDADAGMASLAAARHDFSGALAYGEKALALNPYNATIRAIIGDALIELGRYPAAFVDLQKMIDLRPDVSTYARVSYAQELQGNDPAAIRSMEMAYEAAGSAADAAWASYYLGELHWNHGDLAAAERYYLRGTRIDPMFVPNDEGLAKVEAARGQTAAALDDYASVTARYPLPQFVLEYGDLAQAAGRTRLADQQYRLFHAEVQLFSANGVDTNLETALFDADHLVDLPAGLAAARAEWSARKSINVADALAWELYANGRPREALRYEERALAIGTQNAGFSFHKAMIELALGRRAAARTDLTEALRVNPQFSFLWAAKARSTLASLGGAA